MKLMWLDSKKIFFFSWAFLVTYTDYFPPTLSDIIVSSPTSIYRPFGVLVVPVSKVVWPDRGTRQRGSDT